MEWTMKKTLIAASALTGALVLAGCGGGGATGSSNAGGVSTEYGADQAAWAEAFADVDPIELRTQSSAAKDSASGADWQGFLDAITEYSDGKITFDVGYSNAYADAAEADAALADGRLDLGQVITQYQPEEFPASNELIAATVNSEFSPVVGNVSSNVWPNQVGFASEEITAEFEEKDLKLLLPYYNTGAGSLFCGEPRATADEINGAVVGASGAKQTEQLQALGASPTSMAFTEFYESLQRGAIDCVQTTPGAVLVSGITEVAPHAVIDPEHAFIAGSSSVAMSGATWDSLPLPAQQLISDMTLEFVYGNIDKNWDHYSTLVEEAGAAGGGVTSLDEDAHAGMQEATEAINAELPEDLASSSQEAADHWKTTVEGADLEPVESFDDLDGWLNDENRDSVRAFIESTVQQEIFAEQRPE